MTMQPIVAPPRTGQAVSLDKIDPRAREAFWDVVEDCLVEFHKLLRPDAQNLAGVLRGQVEQPPPGIAGDLIYHDEPFDVACDLANNPLDLTQHRSQYDPILRRHNW